MKIDVHCLVHKEIKYFPILKRQMEKEDVNFFVINNGTNLGEGRIKGFTKGNSPYVSFVDYDDLVEPGIFNLIEKVLDSGYDWCYTDEMLIDKDGNYINPGWSSHPFLYHPYLLKFNKIGDNKYCHHILAFRRELITVEMLYILKQLSEYTISYIMGELSKHKNHYHIPCIGYYWRIHGDNAIFKSAAYKELSKVAIEQGLMREGERRII